MIGGLGRRAMFFQKLARETKAPVLYVDLGNLVMDPSLQSEVKLTTILASYRIMNAYAATVGLTLGPRDLSLDPGLLVRELGAAQEIPFVAANVDVEALGPLVTPYRTFEVAGLTVFITACVEPEVLGGLPGVALRDPVEAVRGLAQEAEAADLRILLAHAEAETCRSWIEQLPFFDVVVGGTNQENPSQPETIGKTTFVSPGIWGKYGLALRLKRGDDGTWTGPLTKVPLAEELGMDPLVKTELIVYQEKIKDIDQNPELRALLHGEPKPHPGGEFVGSKACADCHQKSYDIYVASKHHEALETLKKLDKHVDPECIVCHVVGYGYVSGFTTANPLPELAGVGCEACHGPGKNHADTGEANDIKLGGEEDCRVCHTELQSPGFHYEDAFAGIAHPEEE
jgi:hypothetical protein